MTAVPNFWQFFDRYELYVSFPTIFIQYNTGGPWKYNSWFTILDSMILHEQQSAGLSVVGM
jgi:hypothetical protein